MLFVGDPDKMVWVGRCMRCGSISEITGIKSGKMEMFGDGSAPSVCEIVFDDEVCEGMIVAYPCWHERAKAFKEQAVYLKMKGEEIR